MIGKVALAALFLLSATGAVRAQIPNEFKNLQVLPKTISRAELVARMRQIATDLGVRCHDCHVGPEDLQGMDFATDEKRMKQVARTMLKMVQDINANYVSTIPNASQSVTCITCHRRSAKPTRPLHDLVLEEVVASGAAAALARYQALRLEFFGSGLYDFREHTLNIVGNRLRDERKMLPESYAMFQKNADLFPASANAQFAAGQSARQIGKVDDAAAFYKKALAIDPNHEAARRALESIGK
jgi:tetratricopeptide (TPR) repeat protein